MIQYYLDLEKQVKSIKEKSLRNGQIQKIYSTAFFVSMAIRTPGKTWHLYFGRGTGREGVWLGENPPPSVLRRKDTFLEYLRSHLSACSFSDIELDQSDRIVSLEYRKYGEKQSLLLFWRGRKLYFLHYYQEGPEGPFKLLLSWKGKAVTPGVELESSLFDYFNEVGRQEDMSHDISSLIKPIESELNEELQQASIKKTSAPNFLQRKKSNIEEDLRKTKQWEKLQDLLEKNAPLDELYELKVDDQKIKFEGTLNSFERRNLLFQKIKKLKKGESILKERLKAVEEELIGKPKVEKVSTLIPMIRPVWGEEKIQPHLSSVKTTEDYKVFKFDQFQIGVGVSALSNDQLRNKWANRDDYWLHLDGLKSAHVVIKVQQGSLSPEVLDLGATIVAYFSHFSDAWIPIIYTQVKNVKGVSGASGMVTFKKEKHLRCSRINLEEILKD